MNRFLSWMAENHVAANILLFLLVGGGAYTALSIKQEVFPTVEMDFIFINASYPGAGAYESEEALCLPVEEVLEENLDINKITCNAREGGANLTLELNEGSQVTDVLNEVKNSVATISFAEHAEIDKISQKVRRREVLSLILYGSENTDHLIREALRLRNALLRHSEISSVEIPDLPPQEIIVEADQDLLLHHGLSLTDLAKVIRESAQDLPAGSVATRDGDIALRTTEKKQSPEALSHIVVKPGFSGQGVRLDSLAHVSGGFNTGGKQSFLDGQPAVRIDVFRTGNQTPVGISEAVKSILKDRESDPSALGSVLIWNDRSEIFEDRFNLMLKNAGIGLLLVMTALSLFLRLSLALWVGVGIAVSFIGALIFLPMADISINMISLFGFILVLGIVVDDAIIIGENIYRHRENGRPPLEAAKAGVREMAMPVVFAILTTMVAFTPLMMSSGHMGKFIRAIPWIIVLTLGISLIECLLILPAHLTRPVRMPTTGAGLWLEHTRKKCSDSMSWVIQNPFQNALKKSIENRYITIAIALSVLMICLSLVGGGIIHTVFFPRIERDVAKATFTLPPGTRIEKAFELTRKLEKSGQETALKMHHSDPAPDTPVLSVYSTIQGSSSSGSRSTTKGNVRFLLRSAPERNFSTIRFSDQWRDHTGSLPSVEKITYSAHWGSWGEDLSFDLSHPDPKLLDSVVSRTKKELGNYPGVSDISDSLSKGKKELRFQLSDEAKASGLTPALVARQVRASYIGEEAFRFSREGEEVAVLVRLPEAFRVRFAGLKQLRLQTPDGGSVPFSQAVIPSTGTSPTGIERVDRQRITNVSARVQKGAVDPAAIEKEVSTGFLSDLKNNNPGLSISSAGAQKNRRHSDRDLRKGFLIALLCIYALLAVLFSSYAQPLIVMAAIPFGLAGAIIGHLILGYPLSFLSFFGIVGLSGVVVNDSLILIACINNNKSRFDSVTEAVIEGAKTRFRPIILTSLTTFAGLMPMLAETSRQARFLVPMAISLGVGVLFATVITLVIIPTFYVILDDLSSRQNKTAGQS